MHQVLRLAAAGLVFAVLASCSSVNGTVGRADGNPVGDTAREPAAVGKLQVVASTNVWGDIAGQVGGDHVTVTSLIDDPSQDPHEFQPSGRDELAVSRADVVIVNGGGYDDVLDQMLESVGRGAAVVTAVDAAAAVPSVDPGNEHVWFDIDAVAAVASAVADALAERDPQHAQDFRAHAATFIESLDPIRATLADIERARAGTPVVVTEPLPLYLVSAAGLTDVTPEPFTEAMEEGIDVSPGDLAQVLRLFEDHRVKLLIYNEQSAGAQVAQVLAAAQHNLVPVMSVAELLPAGEDYQEWMSGITETLERRLGDVSIP